MLVYAAASFKNHRLHIQILIAILNMLHIWTRLGAIAEIPYYRNHQSRPDSASNPEAQQ